MLVQNNVITYNIKTLEFFHILSHSSNIIVFQQFTQICTNVSFIHSVLCKVVNYAIQSTEYKFANTAVNFRECLTKFQDLNYILCNKIIYINYVFQKKTSV